MRKGQAELIAILAIIIVAVVAILYATQTISPPQPVTQEQKSVMNSLENLIRSGADEALRTLTTQGGYASPAQDSANFLSSPVPYWQKGGISSIPNAKLNFQQKLEEYISSQKDDFVSGLSGDITIGEPSVSANFLSSKILLNVNLPATHNGQPLPPQYELEILTNFGEVLDFSENFVQSQNSQRYLEYFILASMLSSPIEDGEFTTPMFIHLTDCGDFVFKTYSDVKPSVEERIETTLAHTYMPGKAPTNVGDITSFPKYIIPQLDGKSYSDLEISFHLPDDYSLDYTNFQFSPNPIIATAEPIAFTGICVSDPIAVSYYINTPVIVRVKDPITGYDLRFALQVFIKENKPGPWGSPEIYEQQLLQEICADPGCDIDLALSSLQGNPIQFADVSFMSCSLGTTDSQGKLVGKAPCGSGPLEIYRSGYEPHQAMYTYSDLENLTVVLAKLVSPKVFFYEASVVNNTLTGEYWVNAVNPPEDRQVMLTLRSMTVPTQVYNRVFKEESGVLTGMPADVYQVSGTLTDEKFAGFYGSFTSILYLEEDTTELHFYIPFNLELSQLTDPNEVNIASLIYSSTLNNCGIGPIEPSPAGEELIPCIKKYSDV